LLPILIEIPHEQILSYLGETGYRLSDFTIDPLYTQEPTQQLTVEQMLLYVQNVGPLSIDRIKFIVNRLFDSYTYSVYAEVAKYKRVNDIPMHIFHDLLKCGFIVTNLNKTQVKYDINELFSQGLHQAIHKTTLSCVLGLIDHH